MGYQFYVPTRTLFGAGMLSELHNQVMPGKKAMVVISNGRSMKTTGTLDRTLKELKQAGVEIAVFDRVQANPLRSTVMDGAALWMHPRRRRPWQRTTATSGITSLAARAVEKLW